MKRDKIKELVIDELSGVSGCAVEDITEDSHLENDLSLDSIDGVEVICDLERTFAISISDEEMSSLKDMRVREIIDILETKLT